MISSKFVVYYDYCTTYIKEAAARLLHRTQTFVGHELHLLSQADASQRKYEKHLGQFSKEEEEEADNSQLDIPL